MKLLMALCVLFSLNLSAKETQLPTVDHVEVKEYVGKWYAIWSLPQFFTRNCVAQTAEYGIKNETTISVLNTCIKKNGKTNTINGQAEVTNFKTNAELEVTFNSFWTKLFKVKGDYNIIKLSESYDTVMVGSNDRKSLWIMSRTPYLSEETKIEYVKHAKELGFNVSKLEESVF